jgi:hypothetical protein
MPAAEAEITGAVVSGVDGVAEEAPVVIGDTARSAGEEVVAGV